MELDSIPKPLTIEIHGGEGKVLMTIQELKDGRLDVIGDPEDYTEAGIRFLQGLAEIGLGKAWINRVALTEDSGQRVLRAFAMATVDPEISAEEGDRMRRAFGRALQEQENAK
jgi:hypothetical protein